MFRHSRINGKNRFLYGGAPGQRRKFSLPKINVPSSALKIAAVAIFFSLFAGGIFYFFAFADAFAIDEIRVSSEEDISHIKDTVKESLRDLYGKNLLFFRPPEMEKNLLEAHPELEFIRIKKDFPDTVIVTFREFPVTANVINTVRMEKSAVRQKKFLVNQKGLAVKSDTENPNLPYIKMTTSSPLELGTVIIPETRMAYIIGAIRACEETAKMRVIDAEYLVSARELHLRTEKQFFIWLDMEIPYEPQFTALARAMQKLDIYKTPLSYIDLRVAAASSRRVIYKKK